MGEGQEARIRWAVRESCRLIRWHDAARFRARWKSRLYAGPPDEYDIPALAVARAMLDGARADGAVENLCREVDRLYGRRLARQRSFLLQDDLQSLATALSSWGREQ